MHIAILVPHRGGGSGGFLKHLQQVVPRWQRSEEVRQVTMVVPGGLLAELEELGVYVHRVARDTHRHGVLEMARFVDWSDFDVALTTTARPVPVRRLPLVTMVQNVEPLQRACYPMSLRWRIRLWALGWENWRACRAASRVVAVSEYTKECVKRSLGITGKVDVVYHGFDHGETRSCRRPAIGLPDGRFIFSAGSLVPYRGYEDGIRALAILREQGKQIPTLVLAGEGGTLACSYERWLRRLPHDLGVADRVVWAGQLCRDEMNWCFQNAAAFVQNSRAEACPNTLLEALGNGSVIVSCSQPPMPEILAHAAVYYETGDASDLARKLADVLSWGAQAIGMQRQKARQRAGFFSWDKTATETLAVLRRAVQEFRPTRA